MTVETRKARKDRIDRLEEEAQVQWKAVMECEENSIGEQIEEYPVVEFRQWPNMLKDNRGSPWGEIWEKRKEKGRRQRDNGGEISDETMNRGTWRIRQGAQ